ncbi:TAXI family TRAP transporter solute-binding subunit [Alteribacter keqinensis]|uniref:TAXI family TRAP transporter solute-binding subunit n=1 Tax=Alteribacter keqinensis TaxID=2483800 RepID=A0A3M7TYW1_9BACI|nr:TAXI family TRAP transporter solute-binding subunit [Alteribacter keqinensis]RNA70092.1 TAXI family TRAP transporter solute-binding subunit [Alteribacter keqinensis]
MKKFYTMFASALTLGMLLSACGDGDTDENGGTVDEGDDNGQEEAAGDVDVSGLQIGTGSTGGTYYPLGQEMANVINANIEGYDDFDLSAVSTGASVENLASIGLGELELGMTVHLPALDAVDGSGEFEELDMTIDNFGFMGHIYPEVMQIVVRADADIETVADLEGMNVAIGPPGSGTQDAAKMILEAYGLEDGDYNAFDEGFGDAAGRLQDGNLDASFGLLGLPAGSIEELALQRDVKLLSLSDEAVSYIEDNSGYELMEIPADSYDFMDESVNAITAYAILVGSTDLIDEDLGYEIVKALYENWESVSHDQGQHLDPENIMNGSDGLPMHPGAERFFEEQGYLD